MVIDRVGNINKVLGNERIQSSKSKEAVSKPGVDSVSISQEAQKAQEFAKVLNTVKEAPDIRREKVNSIKQKLSNGEYDGPQAQILEKVAEKIAEALIR